MRNIFLAVLLFFLFPYSAKSETGGFSELRSLFNELDTAIEEADLYERAKELRINAIYNQLRVRTDYPEIKFHVYEQLYDEYRTYKYGNAVNILDEAMNLAEELKDSEKINNVLLKKAMINTTSAMYLEADMILNVQIDTTKLTASQQIEYWRVMQHFCHDYYEYISDTTQREILLAKWEYYRNCILSNTDHTERIHQEILVRKYIDSEEWDKADALNREILSRMDPLDQSYGTLTYYQYLISDALNQETEVYKWLIHSSISDLKCATKDNTSLFCLARILFANGEVERAFKYIMVSLDDARFFDSKLRQWQIFDIFPTIQRSYEEVRLKHDARIKTYLILLILFVILAILGIVDAASLYRKQKILNKKLSGMNDSLAEANVAKEEYIRLSLAMNSQYIDKIKTYNANVRKYLRTGDESQLSALSSSSKMENELKEFYYTFDRSFIKLYPRFIEQFNALLKPEARIKLKNGEILNTELRIFALIKLGITQSSQIASFLRYSVNTIYNYRAQIKNSALGDRDEFEDKIRSIGN